MAYFEAPFRRAMLRRVKGKLVTKDLSIGSQTDRVPCRSSETGEAPASPFQLEPFVDPKTVSAFLAIPRADVLRMTREGKIRGYPYKGRMRHVYRYRLSEVSADFEALACQPKRTMPEAPVSRRRRSSNG